jgi:uncharacterized membrane protein YidH (DUF202 family)
MIEPTEPAEPTGPTERAEPSRPSEPSRRRTGPMRNGVDGASAERTRLAWRRTTLASTAVTLLTIRLAARESATPLHVVAIVAGVVGWIALMVITQRRIRAMAADEPRRVGRALPATALVIAGYAVLGLILVTDRSGH